MLFGSTCGFRFFGEMVIEPDVFGKYCVGYGIFSAAGCDCFVFCKLCEVPLKGCCRNVCCFGKFFLRDAGGVHDCPEDLLRSFPLNEMFHELK